MHNVIRGAEAWERLEKIDAENPFTFSTNVDGLDVEFVVENVLTKRQEEFLENLVRVKRNGNLVRIVDGIHRRIWASHGALPEMMIAEDTYPWRHQIIFVWNERYRQEQHQRGVRYWLPTLLQFKVEDVAMPPEEKPELPQPEAPPA